MYISLILVTFILVKDVCGPSITKLHPPVWIDILCIYRLLGSVPQYSDILTITNLPRP